MKRVNYYLTDLQYRAINSLAKKTGLSVSEHLRRAIDLYLKESGVNVERFALDRDNEDSQSEPVETKDT